MVSQPRIDTTQTVECVEVRFDSGGTDCAASLYRPAGAAGTVPCVVMGHGFSGTRDLGLPAYAERFATAGLAALVFDYRHFGTSGEQLRQLVDIAGQQADFQAAIRFARGCADIDSDRIALWGTSLGGGHVLAVAAADPRIAAVVSQVPFVGIELGRASPRSTRTTLALFSAAVRDTFRGFLGRPPYLIPVVGAADAVAAFPDPTAAIVLGDLAETVPTWRNAVAARVLFPLLWYRPGAQAKHLRMPLLVCIAERDTAGSVRLAMAAARQAPRGELRRYATGHWEVYRPPMIEQLASDQIRFLRTHLRLV